MPAGKPPAVLVVCGTAVGRSRCPRGADRYAVGGLPVPVTWLAAADRLSELAPALAASPGRHEFACEIPASAFASRRQLRTLLAEARGAVPGIQAVAVRQAEAIAHRELLVEEGIRVVLVRSLPAQGRGSRRPAPAGWRCRNATWGLWEIEWTTARRRGPLAGIGLGGLPRVRAGGLGVLAVDGLAESGGINPRLRRLADWAVRQATCGRATVATVSDLAACLAGDEHPTLAGSVLRAA